MAKMALRVALISLVALVFFDAGRAQSTAAIAVSVNRLFDGSTLGGWQGDVGGWRVENGLLVGGGPAGSTLKSEKEFKNFVLKIEYRVAGEGGLGAIMFRMRPDPASGRSLGYQAERGKDRTGALVSSGRVLRNADQRAMGQVTALEKIGDWNTLDIRVEGPRVAETALSGVLQDVHSLC